MPCGARRPSVPCRISRSRASACRAVSSARWAWSGAAAGVNAELGHLPRTVAKAIQTAAAEVAAGDWDAHFPIDVYQTGSGTSSNMNANEVIATLANRAGKAGKTVVHPNDHVNQGQSSNDVIPTALRVSAVLATHEQLLPALVHLRKTLTRRAAACARWSRPVAPT